MPETSSESPAFGTPGFNWAEYIEHRPAYTSSYYNRIYKYHTQHSNIWEVAHDVGTGPGNTAQELAIKFKHVILSDPVPSYVDIAKDRLTKDFKYPESQFTFLKEPAEENSVQDGTVDFLVCAQAIHFTDPETAMASFARQVKSGGTLAITFYSRARIVGNPKASEALDKIWNTWSTNFVKMGERQARSLTFMDSGFDNIPIPEQDWESGAKRIIINGEGLKDPIRMSANDPVPFVNRAGENDVRETEQDESWTDVKNLQWLKDFFKSVLPRVTGDEVNGWWTEIEEAVGGPHAPIKIIHPAVVLLATRK